ncbi:TonB-dependent receptor plug domain-containing protein [Roseateles sp. BYS180W]|uniref:TonB-dependent receptor plug domain-containing protein n=1 Tax=Roseateles rivi TaxID=3299028 RepID=A0ABW7FXR3_9BURK
MHTPASAAFFWLLLLSAVPTAALAQETTSAEGEGPSKAPAAKLERVEINARPQSDTDLRRRAPVAKQLYGREELDKYGDTAVTEVLKRLPGVDLSTGAPRMRGLGAGYTLILINGDPAPPGFQLDQLHPSQVERIEVIKGPSAEHSAQAVAGAINIILKDAPKTTSMEARVGLGYSYDQPRPGLHMAYHHKQGALAYSVPLSLFSWKGVGERTTLTQSLGSDQQPASSLVHVLQPNWGHGYNFAPRLNWKRGDDDNVSLSTFMQKGFWHNRLSLQPLSLQGRPVLDDPSYNEGVWHNQNLNLAWNKRLDEDRKFELKAGWFRSGGEFDNEFTRAAGLRRVWGGNDTYGLTQAGKFSQLVGDSHSLMLGWDIDHRRRSDERNTQELAAAPVLEQDQFARVRRLAVFVQDEWELTPQWGLYLGLRHEQINTQSSVEGQPLRHTSRVTSPLLHLNYKFDPKGRDLIRSSLTRSYKAPGLNALTAPYAVSNRYPDLSRPNDMLSPDRGGNPLLRPELATGLDVAYETYFSGGGMASVGVFVREVQDLVRNVIALEQVGGLARYVSRPQNFSKARSHGLELELKGRAGELLPALFDPQTALNLRTSLNIYRSKIKALPLPNARLEGQQPWSATLGLDYRARALPVSMGLNLAYTPGFATQQTAQQLQTQSASRSADAFVQYTLSKQMSLRLAVNNIAPLDGRNTTRFDDGSYSQTLSYPRTSYQLGLDIKL